MRFQFEKSYRYRYGTQYIINAVNCTILDLVVEDKNVVDNILYIHIVSTLQLCIPLLIYVYELKIINKI